MDEYPKVIRCGLGTFTVTSAEEEAAYRTPAVAVDVEAEIVTDVEPIDDLAVVPKKKAAPKVGAKKK